MVCLSSARLSDEMFKKVVLDALKPWVAGVHLEDDAREVVLLYCVAAFHCRILE